MKRWWQSKMIWLGAHLVLLFPLLEYARDNSPLLEAYIGKGTGPLSFGLGLLIIWLRNLTRVPIGKPEPPDDNAEHA